VLTRKPPLVAWYSGHKTIQYPPEPDPDRFIAALGEKQVRYILLDEVSGEVRVLFDKVRRARPQNFSTIKSFGGTEIIEFRN